MLQAEPYGPRLECLGHSGDPVHAVPNWLEHPIREQAAPPTSGDTRGEQLAAGDCAELALQHDEGVGGEYGHGDLHDQN